jgi:hypothetical protein
LAVDQAFPFHIATFSRELPVAVPPAAAQKFAAGHEIEFAMYGSVTKDHDPFQVPSTAG